MGFKSHICKTKQNKTKHRVSLGSHLDHGLTGFGRVVASADLLTNPDRSSPWVDPPGRSGFNNYALD